MSLLMPRRTRMFHYPLGDQCAEGRTDAAFDQHGNYRKPSTKHGQPLYASAHGLVF
jgi:hypothetical protein